MFTGLVEAVGTVVGVSVDGARAQITIAADGFSGQLTHGESVAVNGACLTVAKFTEDEWVADVMKVTLDKTSLGAFEAGSRVNLERAVRADSRLGGHIVQGHVDGVGEVVARDSQPDWDDVTVRIPESLRKYVVEHGSLAINGVSLTVARLDGGDVTVSLIPTTLADTTFGDIAVGDVVNLEVDVLAKYVENMVGSKNG